MQRGTRGDQHGRALRGRERTAGDAVDPLVVTREQHVPERPGASPQLLGDGERGLHARRPLESRDAVPERPDAFLDGRTDGRGTAEDVHRRVRVVARPGLVCGPERPQQLGLDVGAQGLIGGAVRVEDRTVAARERCAGQGVGEDVGAGDDGPDGGALGEGRLREAHGRLHGVLRRAEAGGPAGDADLGVGGRCGHAQRDGGSEQRGRHEGAEPRGHEAVLRGGRWCVHGVVSWAGRLGDRETPRTCERLHLVLALMAVSRFPSSQRRCSSHQARSSRATQDR